MSFSIRFLPEDRSWRSDEPVDLSFAAASCGILLEHPCGSRTTCGKCRVRVAVGAPAPSAAELSLLGADAVDDGWRLACALQLDRSATVEIPPVSRSVQLKAFGDDALFSAGFEPTVHAADAFGLAIDVGTTSLAAALIQLSTGTVVTTASALNPQVRFGSDVLERIAFAQANSRGLLELHDALLLALNELIRECSAGARVNSSAVRDVVFVGNPTMLHTLRQIDPTPLGQAPYDAKSESWCGHARSHGFDLPDSVTAYHPPAIRSHVGSDTVAAILATGLDCVEHPTLLVDLGTNSEVVLAMPDGILCTSTAAGPAFEGACIRCGMRGIPGAIEEVRIRPSGSIQTRTIGGEIPKGICGSGLVDAAAELLRTGVLDASGRMRPAVELTSILPARLLERVIELENGGLAVRLSAPNERVVVVTAADIRQLQLVKASIAAGIRLLLARAGLGASDLNAVLLAGAFGNYLRKGSAQAIGLVPRVDLERVRFVGNAAGAGARLMLADRRARDRAEAVAARAEYVELAGHPAFTQAFVDELAFPIVEVHP